MGETTWRRFAEILVLVGLLLLLEGGRGALCQDCMQPVQIERRDFHVRQDDASGDILLEWRPPEMTISNRRPVGAGGGRGRISLTGSNMRTGELFHISFRDEEGELVRTSTLTPEEAGCGDGGYYRHSRCGFRTHMGTGGGGRGRRYYRAFESCQEYTVGLSVSGPAYSYCREPRIAFNRIKTRDTAPGEVTGVQFSNFQDSYWHGLLRWSPPEEGARCVDRYKVEYAKVSPLSSTGSGYGARNRDLRWYPVKLSPKASRRRWAKVERLRRCSDYKFRIIAITAEGKEGKERLETFRTLGCFSSSSSVSAPKTSDTNASIKIFALLLVASSV